MLILNLGIGLVTPPAVLFVGCAIGKVSIEQTVRTMWPFYLSLPATLAAVAYVPGLSLWLPELLTRQ